MFTNDDDNVHKVSESSPVQSRTFRVQLFYLPQGVPIACLISVILAETS